jgi:hypothetical protein
MVTRNVAFFAAHVAAEAENRARWLGNFEDADLAHEACAAHARAALTWRPCGLESGDQALIGARVYTVFPSSISIEARG